jgi:hypothetical protein
MQPTADLYQKDFHAWIEGQASLLRQGRLQEIDPERLAEELEVMGCRERNRLVILLLRLGWGQGTNRQLDGRGQNEAHGHLWCAPNDPKVDQGILPI